MDHGRCVVVVVVAMPNETHMIRKRINVCHEQTRLPLSNSKEKYASAKAESSTTSGTKFGATILLFVGMC